MAHLLARSLVVVPAGLLLIGGCADGSGDAAEDGVIKIAASTNVYGDIAEAIAGDDAEVTSIITSAAQDPHEYEATVQDRLAFDDADIVIENGGGYDPFADTLLEASDADPVVLNAVEISGLSPDEEGHMDEEGHADEEGHGDEEAHEGHDHIEGFNEHVWYDFHAMEALGEELAHQLGEIDPDNADSYQSNYEAFAQQLGDLESSAADVKSSADGRGVAITEPVPLYLLSEVGLLNETPEEFSEAVEEGADVPPRALQETLALFDDDHGDDDHVAVLAYNEQTADSTTEQVLAAAESAGVPVVDFTETLPDGESYVSWQQANLDNLRAALG
jgi:zinc/manganese transport system substrate-binding protein